MDRAEKIAIRAINQYRRRDILPYIGLRYYLENCSARRDRWAHDVAVHLVSTRVQPAYYEVSHFKEIQLNGCVFHRKIHLPGPNEAIAEAALMDMCSQHPEQFQSLDCVYSYRLAKDEQRDGIFEPYFNGFKDRHKAVAEACKQNKSYIVRYMDIKRFYPNISIELAGSVWAATCKASNLPAAYKYLGERLLNDHAAVSAVDGKSSLLTGPAFSHLIADLILHDIDQKMYDHLPGRYFRYVDDVIIVGTEQEVAQHRSILVDLLGSLNLELHDGDKDFVVNSADWLLGEHDFKDESGSSSWMTLIGSLKRYLVANTDTTEKLKLALSNNEFRLPIPEYIADIQERGYLSKLLSYSRTRWMRYKVRNVSLTSLVAEAELLRGIYEQQLIKNINGIDRLTGYERKRKVPKLRYVAGRMVFLATIDQLNKYSSALKSIHETRLLGEVFEAIGKRNISSLIKFGINAVQSAAQVLRLSDQPVICAPESWGETELQGLAILKLNGVSLDIRGVEPEINNELLQFAENPGIDTALMKSDNGFIAEMASLHGCAGKTRHTDILNSAFDPDEQMAFDAINQLHPSSY